jgi:hypothetical protein
MLCQGVLINCPSVLLQDDLGDHNLNQDTLAKKQRRGGIALNRGCFTREEELFSARASKAVILMLSCRTMGAIENLTMW